MKGEVSSHGYALQIPKGKRYKLGKRSYQNETPEQFYFEHLLGELLTDICAKIIEYSYFSKYHTAIDIESICSKSFIEWMKLHKQQTPLRMYTLNYEDIFKALLKVMDLKYLVDLKLNKYRLG